ncbi:hypothetical protein [Burkholderia gladioli]|uniref:hypothetical protein n=1 Tax=Burkholderia gladioli TaxID=28095 RepID=UPI001642942A|nr:hypothetical protein [Burkholderia gladioli]
MGTGGAETRRRPAPQRSAVCRPRTRAALGGEPLRLAMGAGCLHRALDRERRMRAGRLADRQLGVVARIGGPLRGQRRVAARTPGTVLQAQRQCFGARYVRARVAHRLRGAMLEIDRVGIGLARLANRGLGGGLRVAGRRAQRGRAIGRLAPLGGGVGNGRHETGHGGRNQARSEMGRYRIGARATLGGHRLAHQRVTGIGIPSCLASGEPDAGADRDDRDADRRGNEQQGFLHRPG